jgi:hypothetical protein
MKEAMHSRAPNNGWIALGPGLAPTRPLTKIPKTRAVDTSCMRGRFFQSHGYNIHARNT